MNVIIDGMLRLPPFPCSNICQIILLVHSCLVGVDTVSQGQIQNSWRGVVHLNSFWDHWYGWQALQAQASREVWGYALWTFLFPIFPSKTPWRYDKIWSFHFINQKSKNNAVRKYTLIFNQLDNIGQQVDMKQHIKWIYSNIFFWWVK